MRYVAPLVPPNCPVCGSEYRGGAFRPGQRFKPGFRVFYQCGCCVSLPKDINEHLYTTNGSYLLISNCFCERNLYGEDGLSDCEQIACQEPIKFDPTELNKKFEDGKYFVVEIDDGVPYTLEMDSLNDNEEIKINRGDGVLVMFTSKEKFDKFVGDDEFNCRKLTKKSIVKRYGQDYSHAIIDPVYYDEGNNNIVLLVNNALLTKLK